MKNLFEGMNKREKTFYILRIAVSLCVVIFALLKLLKIWDNALFAAQPMLGVLLIITGIENYKKSRPISLISIFTGIFLFIMTWYTIFIK